MYSSRRHSVLGVILLISLLLFCGHLYNSSTYLDPPVSKVAREHPFMFRCVKARLPEPLSQTDTIFPAVLLLEFDVEVPVPSNLTSEERLAFVSRLWEKKHVECREIFDEA